MSKQNIPGININAGLELYGDEMDIYISVLKSFTANTPDAIEKLRNVTQETIKDYTIVIHGLKSVCATIAAEEISEKAKKLEAMAKAGDIKGVLAGNSSLIKETEMLIVNINNWLILTGNK
jgi:HPt (histidine-containing phosphotransfer) domain-containing protein